MSSAIATPIKNVPLPHSYKAMSIAFCTLKTKNKICCVTFYCLIFKQLKSVILVLLHAYSYEMQ